MAPKRSNKPPRRSLYPCVTSYLIQVLQVLSACTVSGVMFFFISHLHGKSYTMPWMFFMVSRHLSLQEVPHPFPDSILILCKLQASALLTLIAILGLSIWGCLRGPIPFIGSIIHGVLFVSWGIGFGLLAHAMSTTITRPCTTVYWGNSQGLQICTLYKALFAGAAMGV